MIDQMLVSILENDGPWETYFRDSRGNWYHMNGPLTPAQREYLVKREFRADPMGCEIKDPEHDMQVQADRKLSFERGEPWYCDQHPEEFTREAIFKRHGIIIQ